MRAFLGCCVALRRDDRANCAPAAQVLDERGDQKSVTELHCLHPETWRQAAFALAPQPTALPLAQCCRTCGYHVTALRVSVSWSRLPVSCTTTDLLLVWARINPSQDVRNIRKTDLPGMNATLPN